jgi:hypothetical protein
MKKRRRMALLWTLMAVVALMGSTSSGSEDQHPVLQRFEAFQHHFDQHQGRRRLVLLADPG